MGSQSVIGWSHRLQFILCCRMCRNPHRSLSPLAVRCGNTIVGAQSPQSWKRALLSLTCLLPLPVKGISCDFSREIAGIMYSA